jgi:ribonuclease M5
MEDLRRLGLAGADGSAGLRAAVARELGTGYGNAGGMLKRLRGFGIGRDELEETVRKIKKEKAQ